MKYLEALILGLVQGVTEFLPVSSSGHLTILEHFGIGEESLAFNLLLHLATLLAVCIVYRKKLLAMLKKPFSKEVLFIVVASVPTAVIALLVRLYVIGDNVRILPFGFMVTAVMLTIGEISKRKSRPFKEHGFLSAVITGTAQGIASVSGISRSGSTVSVQLMMGIDAETAGDFSFILSIPVILGSALVELFAFSGTSAINWGAAAVGMLAAFFSGLAAIKFFLKLLKKGSLLPFSLYMFCLSIACFFIVY